jgi:hypothetical protein
MSAPHSVSESAPQPKSLPRQVFVIRAWRQKRDQAWRGQILLTASDLIISFDSETQLITYLQTLLQGTDESPQQRGLK